MEPSRNKYTQTPQLFLAAALGLLMLGLLFGLLGSLQYIIPGLLKGNLSFERVRPLHVSSVLFWIILGATGVVFTYLQEFTGRRIFSRRLLRIQLLLFLISIAFILASYVLGVFGGREYWEFPPLFSIPITAGWVLFMINFFRTLTTAKDLPVYVWMWITGIAFFLFTYLESNLWIFPYFRNDVVNDMLIQWKSYGSMVGAWNMLIYGSGIFLLDKISGTDTYSRSKIAFALYFLGLFNLMFNWGHHIYTLPAHQWVKNISYAVSMTELILIGRIIYKWRSSLAAARRFAHISTYRFIVAADLWILLNLLLAVMMSIPGINIYTHGTHVTVAHTMGATIGINSFLLLSFIIDIIKDRYGELIPERRMIHTGFWITNLSLLVFWTSLIIAGVIKAKWQMSSDRTPFAEMMVHLKPVFGIFAISGASLLLGMFMVVIPLLKRLVTGYIAVKE